MNPASHKASKIPPDEQGEWISAYIDGELTAEEAAEVERLFAEEPSAARLAAELRGVSQVVRQSPQPAIGGDMRSAVLAEALRRQAAGGAAPAAEPVEPRPLEPEGEFGLPFGGSMSKWAWAGVAIAATVLIGFYGRPDRPSGAGAVAQGGPQATQQQRLAEQQHRRYLAQQQYEQALQAMRQATGVQVVNYEATPQTLRRLQQRLAARPAILPGELRAVSEKGLVEPVDPSSTPLDDEALVEGEEQLFYVDANEAELAEMLQELTDEQPGEVYRVGADQGSAPDRPASDRPAPDRPGTQSVAQSATPPSAATPGAAQAAGTIRGVRLRLNLTPEALAKLRAQAAAQPGEPQRRLVVLRIQVKPTAAAQPQ